jgi:hypothetical protein
MAWRIVLVTLRRAFSAYEPDRRGLPPSPVARLSSAISASRSALRFASRRGRNAVARWLPCWAPTCPSLVPPEVTPAVSQACRPGQGRLPPAELPLPTLGR